MSQDAIVVSGCAKVVNAVTQICEALDVIEGIGETFSGANITLANFTDALASSEATAHVTPATLNNILTAFAPSIPTGLKALYSGTPTQQGWAAFMNARRT